MNIEMPVCQELTTVPAGTTIEIVRITEEVSDNHEMMRFLQDNNLMPKVRFFLKSVSREENAVTHRPSIQRRTSNMLS